jgi:IclR family transcriptional regulator, KDG regulon repressor
MTNQPSENKTYFVQALERAIDILDCFSSERREVTSVQVTKLTGLNRTTVTRILNHLTNRNLLKFDAETKYYRLGSKIIELGGIAISSHSVRQVARNHLSLLRDEIGYTVLLGAISEDHFIFADKHEGSSLITLSSGIGSRHPLSYGLFGMVLLAHQSRELQERILKEYPLKALTPETRINKKQYLQEMAGIVKEGYFIDRELFHEDIGGICASVRDYSGDVIACVGAAINATKLKSTEDTKGLINQIVKTAAAISSDLGFTGKGS